MATASAASRKPERSRLAPSDPRRLELLAQVRDTDFNQDARRAAHDLLVLQEEQECSGGAV